MLKILCLSFLFTLTLQNCSAKLPPTITPCHRNDVHLDRCIIKAVNNLKPFMANGDFGNGYRTIPLEPLHLDNIEIIKSNQFSAVVSNLEAHGGSNFIINQLKANASAISYDVTLTLPKIEFNGKYFMKMNILLFDIQGQGDMKGLAENIKAVSNMRGIRYLRNGVEYVKMTKMPIHLTVGKFKLHLDNLFNGDKTLGQIGNAIINDNQQLYLKEIIPGLERALSNKFMVIANEILSNATFDEMFPTN